MCVFVEGGGINLQLCACKIMSEITSFIECIDAGDIESEITCVILCLYSLPTKQQHFKGSSVPCHYSRLLFQGTEAYRVASNSNSVASKHLLWYSCAEKNHSTYSLRFVSWVQLQAPNFQHAVAIAKPCSASHPSMHLGFPLSEAWKVLLGHSHFVWDPRGGPCITLSHRHQQAFHETDRCRIMTW